MVLLNLQVPALGLNHCSCDLGHFAQPLWLPSAWDTHRWAAGRSPLPVGTWTPGVPTPSRFNALLLPLQGFESGSSPQEQPNILGGDPSKGDINCLAARSCFDSPSCDCSFHSFHGLVLLTGDPQTFTVFSLISTLKVRKVKSAILGLPLSFFLPYREEV